MKNIIVLLLCIIVTQQTNAQIRCNPSGITTNPDAPINNLNPSMINDFFDWRATDYAPYINSDYYIDDPSFVEIGNSPFWSDEPYLDYLSVFDTNDPDDSMVDYAANEGWELITRGLGKYKDETPVNSFSYLYILLYNKYKGKMRMLFALPPALTQGFVTNLEFEIAFNGSLEGDVNAMLSHNDKIAQPLDTKTGFIKFHAQTDIVESGWSLLEFPVTYDPCVCKNATAFSVSLTKLQESDAYLSGSFIGGNYPINGSPTNPDSYSLTDRQLNVLKNGFDPYVGVETYKNLEKYYNQYKSANTINTSTKKIAKGIKDFVGATSKLPVVGDALKTVKTAVDLFAYGTGLLPEDKKTFPTIIDGTMTMSGQIISNELIDRAAFVVEVPGAADSLNTREFGNSEVPAYPFYNEALGRFAMLKTPVLKRSTIETDISEAIGEDEGELFRYKYVYQLEENSLDFVFNPAIGVNLENTKVYGSIVVETGTPAFFMAQQGDVAKNLVHTGNRNTPVDFTNIFKSPFVPIECMKELTSEYVYKNVHTDFLPQWHTPKQELVLETEIKNVYIQLMIMYEFDELNRNGEPNRDMQLITYPITFNDNHGTTLQGSLDDMPADITISTTNYTQSQTIAAFNTVTIDGDLTTTSNTNIIIRANEIILADGANIGAGITLEQGSPLACGSVVQPFSGDMISYCDEGDYQGDIPKRMPIIKEEAPKVIVSEVEMEVSPNPTTGEALLSLKGIDANTNASITVTNMVGQILWETQITIQEERTSINIDVSKYPAGTYNVLCNTNNGETKTIKIVKQ